MISPRSLANQKLYHARILANSWREQLGSETIPATVLAEAFEQPARDCLRLAYGWFLLEIIQPAALPETPPESSDDLPVIAAGKVLPPEIQELRQLEKQGWLEAMLRLSDTGSPGVRSAGNLAQSVKESIGPDLIDQWIEQLHSIFDRMADSLDEY